LSWICSYQHDYLDDQVTRLHKIYLLPEAQGKRVLLIDAVVAYAKENHSKTLSLNVNRFNKAVSL
jgi:GNAT superfamily N-acetyltransferase